ncbi:MAG: trypsin-like peptidase domain-containing protein [Pirellulales bacterium]|nr:trypsin-like peptidase domain-containing protein [Pirellulales bacterium]
MTQQLSTVEQLGYSTVRIECDFPDGSRGTGTGFFFSFAREGNMQVPAIITNKHVIKGASTGRFTVTLSGSDGRPDYGNNRLCEFDGFEAMWKSHPDPDVDLCAMPIAPLLRMADSRGDPLFYRHLEEGLIPSDTEMDDFVGLEEITMIGYPNGLWDEKNNLPIFRRGVLASHLARDWNGKKEFLIDAACFPGSSGSPVLLVNEGAFQTRTALRIGSRLKLLGVLYAGPQHTVTGEIEIVNVPIHQKPIAVAGIPNNLGIVIKAHRIRDFESVFSN